MVEVWHSTRRTTGFSPSHPTVRQVPCEAGAVDVRSDRRYRFGVGPEALWSSFLQLDDYQRWWPWLRNFEGSAIASGERWSCVVQPPLPYSLRFDLLFDEVVAARSARARVVGDITGHARIDIEAIYMGSELRLVSHLTPASRMLRAIARVAGPVATFGHDWVLDTGFRQFQSRVVEGGINGAAIEPPVP